MKKILLFILIISCSLALVACGGGESNTSGNNSNTGNTENGGGNEQKPAEIIGVTYENSTHIFDGEEYTHKVSGILPSGVSVEYKNNKGTDIGVYHATAILSGENYITKTLTSTFEIVFADNLSNLEKALLRLKSSNPNYKGSMETKTVGLQTTNEVKEINGEYVKEEFTSVYLYKSYKYQKLSSHETFTWEQEKNDNDEIYYKLDRKEFEDGNNDLLNEFLPFNFSFDNLNVDQFTEVSETEYKMSGLSGFVVNSLLNLTLDISNEQETRLSFGYTNDSLVDVEINFIFSEFGEIDFELPELPTAESFFDEAAQEIYSNNYEAKYELRQPGANVNKIFAVNGNNVTETHTDGFNKDYFHVIDGSNITTFFENTDFHTEENKEVYDKTTSTFTNYLSLMLGEEINSTFFSNNNFALGYDENTYESTKQLNDYHSVIIEIVKDFEEIKISFNHDEEKEIITELTLKFKETQTNTAPVVTKTTDVVFNTFFETLNTNNYTIKLKGIDDNFIYRVDGDKIDVLEDGAFSNTYLQSLNINGKYQTYTDGVWTNISSTDTTFDVFNYIVNDDISYSMLTYDKFEVDGNVFTATFGDITIVIKLKDGLKDGFNNSTIEVTYSDDTKQEFTFSDINETTLDDYPY